MNSIRAVIVDDHEVVRSGLASLIQTWFPLRVIGQFASGETLLNDAAILAEADLVILDNLLGGISGEETYQQLLGSGWRGVAIVLTVMADEELHRRLLAQGIFRVIQKSDSTENLKQAIADALPALLRMKTDVDTLIAKITPREMEFLRYICNDNEYTYDQIAYFMNVHVRTIDGFRKSLFQKLSIKSKTGLVMFAMRNGLNG
ncbi:MAG: response regulator [Flavobacteriales bacterium]|jgi:two-component system invasion response regulator UvrY